MLKAITKYFKKRKYMFVRLALRNNYEFVQKSHKTNKWWKYRKIAAQIRKNIIQDVWLSNFDKLRAANENHRAARRFTSS